MSMKIYPNISRLIQSHKGISNFNYDLTVDWAIQLLNAGLDTENIYMLASFSKPVDSREIKPYVSAVLRDLKLDEKEGAEAVIFKIKYHLNEILADKFIRNNLNEIYNIWLSNNNRSDLMPLYLLYHGWNELDELGVNFYYDGADKSNIENIIKKEAKSWLEKF